MGFGSFNEEELSDSVRQCARQKLLAVLIPSSLSVASCRTSCVMKGSLIVLAGVTTLTSSQRFSFAGKAKASRKVRNIRGVFADSEGKISG